MGKHGLRHRQSRSSEARSTAEGEPVVAEIAVAGTPDEGSTVGPPGLSPDPDPSTPVRVYQPPRARDVPGSLPAALLLLGVVALGLIERAQTAGGGVPTSVAATCIPLILALGLLLGGKDFRAWGVFSHLAGLLAWPLLLLKGVFGPAGLGDYLGLVFNIGILMLLAGEPTRMRVRAGVAVAVLGIVVSRIASALF